MTEESDTTNNCSASVQVTVPETEREPERHPERHPDLMVTSPTVSDSGPAAGATFTLSATVRNAGEGDAAATTLRYYRSADTTITASDAEVGMDAVAELAAAGSSGQSVELTAPSSPGTYYYGACVEAVTDESDTTNNCSASVQVTVPETEPEPERHPERHPDLVVSSPTVSDSGPAGWGDVHPVGDGSERWRGRCSGDDAEVLPVDGRDDHGDLGHGGGDGRHCRARRSGEQQSIGGS